MAAVRTWPFRVYSFPKDIVVSQSPVIIESTSRGMNAFVEWLNKNTDFDGLAVAHDRLIEDALGFGDGSENLRTVEYPFHSDTILEHISRIKKVS